MGGNNYKVQNGFASFACFFQLFSAKTELAGSIRATPVSKHSGGEGARSLWHFQNAAFITAVRPGERTSYRPEQGRMEHPGHRGQHQKVKKRF